LNVSTNACPMARQRRRSLAVGFELKRKHVALNCLSSFRIRASSCLASIVPSFSKPSLADSLFRLRLDKPPVALRHCPALRFCFCGLALCLYSKPVLVRCRVVPDSVVKAIDAPLIYRRPVWREAHQHLAPFGIQWIDFLF
jgi:hypothetical protein